MGLRIALAGNPNCGKTTLFNALTGSNQFVGNWPGVTVEKKEGCLKHSDGAVICDLPGIYSLSPYTPEEVVARNYLVGECPDVILNVIDATAPERSLYLTTQLTELGIPVVLALNMMDAVRKNGDSIDTAFLSRAFGVPVVEISALKGEGIADAVKCTLDASKKSASPPRHSFSGPVEHAIAHICAAVLGSVPRKRQRWYAVKVFERDKKVLGQLGIAPSVMSDIERRIAAAERELDDDAESIIANERYVYITAVTDRCLRHKRCSQHNACSKRKDRGRATTSDKIDRIVTSRLLGLPIFAAVMFLVYYISMVTVGTAASAWARDGLFGDGFFLFGIGRAQYEEKADALGAYSVPDTVASSGTPGAYGGAMNALSSVSAPDNPSALGVLSVPGASGSSEALDTPDASGAFNVPTVPAAPGAVLYIEENAAPDPSDYGIWVPGVPVLAGELLENAGAPDWLRSLILDGIIAGVGSVLGFVPQLLVLFVFLAFLEACGYMARIAFVLDRVFRGFGLSGRSFIPILIGTGCAVPGIMASRTVENGRERRITVMTTSFIPCGAKVPLISMIAGAIFGGSAWVATSAYFVGMAAIVISGIILKKTRMLAHGASPFVMELPAYRMPTATSVLGSMWERGWSFIKKSGTVILLSSVVLWFLSRFGWAHGSFGMLAEDQLSSSVLAHMASAVSWIFAPLGWGSWRPVVASFTGLVAKENIVGTLGILYGKEGGAYAALAAEFSKSAGYSFLVFNLLCAPCFAAMGAIRREMNSARWTAFAIGYQCAFAYAAALMVNQFGALVAGNVSGAAGTAGVVSAFAVLAVMAYMVVKRG